MCILAPEPADPRFLLKLPGGITATAGVFMLRYVPFFCSFLLFQSFGVGYRFGIEDMYLLFSYAIANIVPRMCICPEWSPFSYQISVM